MSVGGFSDVRSISVFNVVACAHKSLHIASFRLGSQQASAVNLNKTITKVPKDSLVPYWQDCTEWENETQVPHSPILDISLNSIYRPGSGIIGKKL